MACARLVLHLSPTWPPRLQLLTGYTWDNLIPCAEKLLMYVPLVQTCKHGPPEVLQWSVFLLSSAHDSDVKEASKQKVQQQPVQQQQQQQGQSAYHSSGQTATVAQYLHRSGGQYPPQAPQPGLPSYLSHSAASLHAPNVSQQGSVQAIPASLEPKSSIPGRAYQVSLHYTCTAPCFDR